MKKRTLGKSGLEVSSIGFGCMGLDYAYCNKLNKTESISQKGKTPAQIALAWILAKKPWIAPIPGTTKLHRLEENIGAADVELTSEELSEINSALEKIRVAGERYPEELEKRTGL
jgi:aryl-alcohol dehydrogenase-like predicted oxidoreductase